MFIYNLCYYKATILAFTSKIFLKETSAFNWSFFNFEYDLFYYIKPYFTMKNIPYGEDTFTLQHVLKQKRIYNALVVDIPYHQKTIPFLKNIDLFLIGLTPFNMNPWLVHYAIPCGSTNLFTQYFLLKLVIFIRKQALARLFLTNYTKYVLIN